MSLRNRVLAPLSAALVGTLAVGLLGLAPAPASAADPGGKTRTKGDISRSEAVFPRSSYLCYGYADCQQQGMGNAGYAQNSGRMYWQMYAGHNCTNYAAYRMVRSGMPNQRPWTGSGNATNWGSAMSRITDGTPNVGAVAWWRANVGPAGSAGHVAYVEKVVSPDEIIVSQDSWGGNFSWAVITRSSGLWPSGFVHFNDRKMVNKAAPVISGNPKVGGTLQTTAGTWTPGDVKVSYQWYADGVAVKRGRGSTYVLGKRRIGSQMTVRTTASKAGYPSKTVRSAATDPVLPGALRNTAAPAISGTPQVDRTLTVDTGAWNPTPTTLGVQWYADGAPIAGATGTSLTLSPDLVGAQITATVKARRQSYAAVTATSAATDAVLPGVVTVKTAPSVAGETRPGRTLTLDTGVYRPQDAAVSVQWLRDGQPVLNATGPTYRLSGPDLGARMSAQVTVARNGYQTLTTGSPQTAAVKSVAQIRMTRLRLAHRVKLTLRLSARAVDEVTGTVLVKVQGGFRQVVTLRDGKARLSVSGLPRGKRAVTLVYSGSDTVESKVRDRALWMPPAKSGHHRVAGLRSAR